MAAFAVTPAQLADVERLAWLSHSAKLTYRTWAAPGWAPPARGAEVARWERRLRDRAGSTLIAHEGEHALGAVHLTDARAQRGEGKRSRRELIFPGCSSTRRGGARGSAAVCT